MRRFPILGTIMVFSAPFLIGLFACDKAPDPKPGPHNAEGSVDRSKDVEITSAPIGVVHGTVKFKGVPPEDKTDEAMAAHGDKVLCLAGKAMHPEHVVHQTWLVDKNGGVANVVITLEPQAGKKFRIDDKLRDSFPKKPVILDQPYCAYDPHVIAIFAPHQPLIVKNSGGLVHQTTITPPTKKKSEIISRSIPPRTTWDPLTFEQEPGMFRISCSIHPFMSAIMFTFDHPYFAITRRDGSFSIANVPIDEELIITMWHESTGTRSEVGRVTARAKETVVRDLHIGR